MTRYDDNKKHAVRFRVKSKGIELSVDGGEEISAQGNFKNVNVMRDPSEYNWAYIGGINRDVGYHEV